MRGVSALGGDCHSVGVQRDLQAAVQGGEDGGGLGGPGVLRAQREQVVDVLGLEEALLLWVAQHLRASTEQLELNTFIPEGKSHRMLKEALKSFCGLAA